MTQQPLRFDGADYLPWRDDERLTAQLQRVWRAMSDGRWHTLSALAMSTGDPEASVSAQLRHLRKDRFGGHTVEKQYQGDGLFEYRLVPNPDAERVMANAPKRPSRAKVAS